MRKPDIEFANDFRKFIGYLVYKLLNLIDAKVVVLKRLQISSFVTNDKDFFPEISTYLTAKDQSVKERLIWGR
jgi:hypothetical protein